MTRNYRASTVLSHLITEERGSALAIVLILVMVLAVLSGMLLMAFTLHARMARNDLNKTQAFYLAEAGIYKAMWNLSGHEGFDWTWRPQDEVMKVLGAETVQVSINPRGGFLEIISAAQHGNQDEEIRVLVGQRMPEEFAHAIIIGGANFPLVVSGDNKIIGDVTVGSGGVKAGTIRGESFTGGKLVEGRIHRSEKPAMPNFNRHFFQATIERSRRLLRTGFDVEPPSFSDKEGSPRNQGRVVFWQGRIDSRVLNDSLRNRPLTVFSNADLIVSGAIRITAPLSLIAAGQITISDSALLDDALLYSETGITISGQARGAIQAITTGDIEISGDAHLEYPSTLFTTGRILENEILGVIVLKDRAQVTGSVILDDTGFGADNTLRRRTSVLIDRSAKLTGVLYATNQTTIHGQVIGSVITDHFYLYVSPTTYINWLKDAYIDRTGLGEGFKLPLLFDRRPELEIVTWREQ